ncbi:tetratricopeptide repeat protein [Candidatus Lokiarchaeum ossiferum]|uniref:tetratricopeptide repeat protein n=1 Tax=Candidatus Lokiarchaeum ossiferum TaxID=2951803 RepID=UPI00352CCD00
MPSYSQDLDQFMKTYNKLVSINSYHEAEKAIGKFLQKYPKSIEANLELGWIYYMTYRYIEAEQTIQKIRAEIPPSDSNMLCNMYFLSAQIYLGQDLYHSAEEHALLALELDEKNNKILAFILRLLKIQERYSDIVKMVNQFSSTISQSMNATVYFAEALIYLNRYSEAEQVIKFILSQQADFVLGLVHLAKIERERGHFVQTEQLLLKATQSHNYVDEYEPFLAWEQLIDLYLEMDELDKHTKAQSEFNQLVENYRIRFPNSNI